MYYHAQPTTETQQDAARMKTNFFLFLIESSSSSFFEMLSLQQLRLKKQVYFKKGDTKIACSLWFALRQQELLGKEMNNKKLNNQKLQLDYRINFIWPSFTSQQITN